MKFSEWFLRRPVSRERRREAVPREAEGHTKVKSQEMMRPVNTFLRVGASFQLALLWISGVKTGERPPKNTSTPPPSNILLCGWVSPFPTEKRCSATLELPTVSMWPSSEYSLTVTTPSYIEFLLFFKACFALLLNCTCCYHGSHRCFQMNQWKLKKYNVSVAWP